MLEAFDLADVMSFSDYQPPAAPHVDAAALAVREAEAKFRRFEAFFFAEVMVFFDAHHIAAPHVDAAALI